jgi:hypothetical protein
MRFKRLACSFCGRSNDEVAKSVAGPRVYICDRCAYETVRIMDTTPPSNASLAKREAIWRRVFGWVRLTRPLRFGTLL